MGRAGTICGKFLSLGVNVNNFNRATKVPFRLSLPFQLSEQLARDLGRNFAGVPFCTRRTTLSQMIMLMLPRFLR
jgi:hypothetical protein